MPLLPGQHIDLTIEKPAAGGRMIARHDGQVVLVAGAIPGEVVTARVERVEKRLAFASVVAIPAASPDRREAASDLLCGGCTYAHIDYARQVALKSGIVADAFTRIGRIVLDDAIKVAPSAEAGYRMRARLHVRGRTAGFYREGTRDICDARATRQLLPESMQAVDAALGALIDAGTEVRSIELSENVAADQRAVHVEIGSFRGVDEALARAMAAAHLTGCTASNQAGAFAQAGEPRVADPLAALTHGRAAAGELSRAPVSFFQANRFILADLVVAVMDAIMPDGDVLDLYAGVGLFAVSLAATGRAGITAVEGDRQSAADLIHNAAPHAGRLRAVAGRVEDYVARRHPAVGTILVDPPRTGVSRESMDAIARCGARRIVYVSCDPPTMARDARRLIDAGYRLTSLEGFDLFPNTPHVETLGVFDHSRPASGDASASSSSA